MEFVENCDVAKTFFSVIFFHQTLVVYEVDGKIGDKIDEIKVIFNFIFNIFILNIPLFHVSFRFFIVTLLNFVVFITNLPTI